MTAKTADNPTSSDRELVITRTFNAPRELVWKAWTEPARLKQWSAPNGFTIPVSEGDLRPGGKWRACMVKDDGTELWLGGVYQEIAPPERLVFTHAWDKDNGEPGHETTITVVLTERAGKTVMKFRQNGFDSGYSRDGHAEGWGECFDKLDDLLG